MACPYFVPTRKSDDIAWLHPARLPLGAGWSGRCDAPGHEGVEPTADELKEQCNLGYAVACSRLPQNRVWDAVRFSIVRDLPKHLVVCFVCERAHLPVEHGSLEYDIVLGQWTAPHPDARVQNMAECYRESYMQRKIPTSLTA